MDAGFTKGPWVADPRGRVMATHITTAERIEGRKAAIAIVEDDYAEPFAAEQRANARLIAAAPELYWALKGIVDDDDAGVSLADQRARSDARMAAAKAAILKATGA